MLSEAKIESRKQEHLYKALLQDIPGGVIIWNAKEEIIVINDSAHTLLEKM
jgi:sensor histidine kinase regulating citrate/malate metabolism